MKPALAESRAALLASMVMIIKLRRMDGLREKPSTSGPRRDDGGQLQELRADLEPRLLGARQVDLEPDALLLHLEAHDAAALREAVALPGAEDGAPAEGLE